MASFFEAQRSSSYLDTNTKVDAQLCYRNTEPHSNCHRLVTWNVSFPSIAKVSLINSFKAVKRLLYGLPMTATMSVSTMSKLTNLVVMMS
jgi:hypothetical protein